MRVVGKARGTTERFTQCRAMLRYLRNVGHQDDQIDKCSGIFANGF